MAGDLDALAGKRASGSCSSNPAGDGGTTLHTINEVIYWTLLTTLLGSAIGIGIDAWTLICDDRRHAAQVAATA